MSEQLVPTEIQAPGALVKTALEGGYAAVTVRSHRTQQHVKILFVGRKKKDGGRGYVSRATVAGRVGLSDADVIEARDPDREYPDNYVGRLYLDSGQWKAGRDADPLRAWTAERVIGYANGRFELDAQADVFIATQCSSCGRKLTHPESIAELIGPECSGRRRKGRAAPRQLTTEEATAVVLDPEPQLAREELAERAVNGDPEPPEYYADEEARMQGLEAYGDRVQTAREEAEKAVARGLLPASEVSAVVAEAEEAAQALLSGPVPTHVLVREGARQIADPPCMGCGRPESTHTPGECVR